MSRFKQKQFNWQANTKPNTKPFMNNKQNYKRKVHILKKIILCKFKLDIQILHKIQLGIAHLTPEGC